MAILLVFAMLAGIFPVGVFAEEDLVLSSEAGINEEYNESEGEETKENYTGTEEPVTEEEIDEESSTLENKLTYAGQIELSKVDIVTAISDLAVGNETTEDEILAAAQNASLYEVLVSWSETDGFYKIDATVDARGSITGSLVLTLEDASDYILVDKIIEQLPIGDEEKIDEDETKENDIETTESEVEEGSETFVSAQNIFKSSPVSLIMDSGNVTLLLDSSAENDNAERAEGASYLTLGGAISKAESGDTIKLVSDIVINPGVLIIESKDLNLDLNGNNLTGLVEGDYSYNLIQLNGTANLEVTDSSEGVQGSLRGSSHIRPILNTGSGTVTVTNCTISSVDTYAIENASIGEVEVFNGSISSVNNYAINNSSISTVNITSGTIRSDNRYPIYNASNGKVTILDSIISSDKSHGIVNETVGTIEISGGTVSSEEGHAIYNNNDGIVTISNCIVSSRNNGIAIYNYSSRTVSITDSTVSSVNNYTIFNGSTGSVVFNGGEATTSNYFAIGNNGGGNVTISGGSVFGKSGAYISWNNSSMLNIYGGEVSSDGYTLVNNGIVYITGGTISTTREDKVCISSNSMVLNVSGGTLQHVKVNQVNISGDPIVKIALGSLTSKKVSIIGELTGVAGDIILSGKGLTTTNEGTVVATAENEAHADASKFSLIDLEDKILSKDGSNIVIASNTFDLSNGSVTIDNNGEYTITQSGDGPTSNTVTINSDATIYLDGVDILVPKPDSSGDYSKPNPINIDGPYTVNLYLVDGTTNTLASEKADVVYVYNALSRDSGKAAIRVPLGATLNIHGYSGILNATGARGLNASDSAAHGGGGAGIGGNGGHPDAAEGSGNVNIYGGIIKSTGGATGGYWGNGGTGIGGGGAKYGGNDGDSGSLIIYGGNVQAKGGDGSLYTSMFSGYGIGGNLSLIEGEFKAESASSGNNKRSAIAIEPIRLPSSYKWRVREGDGYTLSTSEAYSRESNQRYVEIIPITIVSTLSFDSTGGTPVEQITQNYGTTITPPTAPTRTGYTFTGWSPVVPSTMPAQDLELIAQWEINQYTLSFDSTGGSAVEPITQDYGTAVTSPTNPSRSGHRFAGWYLDQALTAVFNFDAFIVEDMVLYAKWNRISSDDGSSKSSTQLEPAKTMVIINGESTSAGTETKATEDGRSINLVQVNNEVIDNKIEEASKDTEAGLGNTIQIFSTDDDSQVVAFQLTGDMVKKLEENAFDVSVKSNGIEYTIPAREFTISNVAETLKIREKDLKAIQVQVRISKLDDKSLESYREVARENGAELIFTPVSFQVVAKTTRADGSVEEVRIEKFSSYVKRVMEIPAGTDPSKISTGIVFNLDGTYSHVPTEVFLEDGKWYARINSLTNSSYSVIWNPVTVESVASHWSKEVVNDMASRLIIRDPENFMPNENITRGEFAEYITGALGISRAGVVEEKRFIDLEITHELAYSIEIATEYGIIKGYPDGTFKPDEQISREEAMVMYSRAMDIAGLEENDGDKINSYNDRESIAEWAYEHARKTVNAGVFKGKTHETINPKDTFTCAEAATAIRNLLVAADLINK